MKIVDVIVTANNQFFIILDRLPKYEYRYTQNENNIVGTCGPFSELYVKHVDIFAKAFGGQKFKLKLITGENVNCDGQWWHAHPVGYKSVGVATLDGLSHCYVFNSAAVEIEFLDKWLSENTPKSDYYHYEKRRNA